MHNFFVKDSPDILIKRKLPRRQGSDGKSARSELVSIRTGVRMRANYCENID